MIKLNLFWGISIKIFLIFSPLYNGSDFNSPFSSNAWRLFFFLLTKTNLFCNLSKNTFCLFLNIEKSSIIWFWNLSKSFFTNFFISSSLLIKLFLKCCSINAFIYWKLSFIKFIWAFCSKKFRSFFLFNICSFFICSILFWSLRLSSYIFFNLDW